MLTWITNSISKFKGDWPWKADLKGRCACENGYWFDSINGTCTKGIGLQNVHYFTMNRCPFHISSLILDLSRILSFKKPASIQNLMPTVN